MRPHDTKSREAWRKTPICSNRECSFIVAKARARARLKARRERKEQMLRVRLPARVNLVRFDFRLTSGL